ncbi:hypothetical protein [Sphingomonas sp. DT-204]|uniref:hypothetical protein n=1 Tax=Sphingomonas sp. DT-204 TaxID=3396166 RepID=UPI003F1CC8FA
MNGTERRRRYALLAEAASDCRGARFARRLSGTEGPRFADLAKVPDWLTEPPERQERIACLAALLRHRRAIDTELSGPRLAMLAATVGEDLLDAACEMPLSPPLDDAPLPTPDQLVAEGRRLLHAGLPGPFADRFPGARDDAQARALTMSAESIAAVLA